MMGRLLTLLLVLAVPLDAALAQDVVGRAIIDGRKVELLSDNSWRYADDAAALAENCDALGAGIGFCGKDYGWVRTRSPSPEVAAQYRINSRTYAQFVIEELGADDGMTMEFMRAAIIENAANASGQATDAIKILEIEEVNVDGVPGEIIVYGFNFSGLDVVFMNAVIVLPKRSIQAMTYAIEKEWSETHMDLNDDFLTHVRIAQ